MLKTFKIILLAVVTLPTALPTLFGMLGIMWLAHRRAPTKPRQAAWLLLRLATFIRRTLSSKPENQRNSVASFVAPALLLQGAPWERVRRWCEQPGNIKLAFEFYFAEQRFDQALEAAHAWCEQTEAEIAGRETEMRAFFERYGDDLSPQRRGEIQIEFQNAELAKWEANPQGKRPGFFVLWKRVNPQIAPFLRFYDAHLALLATHWITKRHPNSRQLKREFARQRGIPNSLGLPQFHVTEISLRALGMNETKLAVTRRRAQQTEFNGSTTG